MTDDAAPVVLGDLDSGEAPPRSDIQPMLAGTFAIYEDGHGGYVLVTDTPAYGIIRKHVPAALVKIATGGGVMGRKLSAMFGN
jgi:hypothetical protein